MVRVVDASPVQEGTLKECRASSGRYWASSLIKRLRVTTGEQSLQARNRKTRILRPAGGYKEFLVFAGTSRARGCSLLQASAVVVGAVVGIGIFKTPSVVAANVTSEAAFLGLWLLGGVVTLIGALCYAELGSTYPHFGGEYHFLRKAYGPGLGFLFAWGRMAVMQSGSIAAVAFVYGDYASFLFPVGASGSAVHAALAVISLSALQLMGTELSSRAQVAPPIRCFTSSVRLKHG
jgi:Amino acid permease